MRNESVSNWACWHAEMLAFSFDVEVKEYKIVNHVFIDGRLLAIVGDEIKAF